MSKTLIIAILCLNFASAQDLEYTSSLSLGEMTRNLVSNFNFSYVASYQGSSLGGDYQSGATFSRFDGGEQEGKAYDSTGSTQLYQSFRLGYRFSNNWNLAYGVTFQENLNDDIEYSNLWGDKNQRNGGRSYNNHRVSLFAPALVNFDFGWLASSFFYEIPNAVAKSFHMEYGLGIQPTLNLFSSVEGLFWGFNASVERLFYNEQAFNPQGVKISAGPFINYRISDYLIQKNEFNFDWDQKGKEVGTSKFGANMHDVGATGVGIEPYAGTIVDLFVVYSVTQLDIANTAMSARFSLNFN